MVSTQTKSSKGYINHTWRVLFQKVVRNHWDPRNKLTPILLSLSKYTCRNMYITCAYCDFVHFCDAMSCLAMAPSRPGLWFTGKPPLVTWGAPTKPWSEEHTEKKNVPFSYHFWKRYSTLFINLLFKGPQSIDSTLPTFACSCRKIAKHRNSRWKILWVHVRPWHLTATAFILPKYDSSIHVANMDWLSWYSLISLATWNK